MFRGTNLINTREWRLQFPSNHRFIRIMADRIFSKGFLRQADFLITKKKKVKPDRGRVIRAGFGKIVVCVRLIIGIAAFVDEVPGLVSGYGDRISRCFPHHLHLVVVQFGKDDIEI